MVLAELDQLEHGGADGDAGEWKEGDTRWQEIDATTPVVSLTHLGRPSAQSFLDTKHVAP
jgi:hypothetical protein